MLKIFQDLQDYSKGNWIKSFYIILFNQNFHAVALFRIAHFFYKIHFSIISKIITNLIRSLYSIDIDYRSKIDGGFQIIHGIGIVIGFDVKIGKHVKIYQGVTLGGYNNRTKTHNNHALTQPLIENNVTIFANATIIGPVVIGSNTIIGATSFINKSIEENNIVYTKSEMIISEIRESSKNTEDTEDSI